MKYIFLLFIILFAVNIPSFPGALALFVGGYVLYCIWSVMDACKKNN